MDIALHGEAGGHATCCRIRQDDEVKKPRVAVPPNSGAGLGHLHQGQDALLHPRPAGDGIADDRQAVRHGVFKEPGDLLADDSPHGAHHKIRVHHKQAAALRADHCHAADDGFQLAGCRTGGFQLFGVAGKLQQVPGAKPGVVLLEAVRVGQHADALAGVEPEVMAAVNAAVEVIPQKAQGNGPVAIGAGLRRLVLVLVHRRGTAAFFQFIGGILKEIQKWNGHTMHLTLR